MTKINDLRSFMQVLEENGQLVTIHKTVSRELEIGSVLATLESANLGAGYMKSVEGSEFAVVGNMLGSMDRIALALGCEKNVITDFLGKCLDNPIPPVEVTNAPCQQNVMRGEDVDLFKLPIPRHAPKDGGPFITGGVIVSRDPEGTTQNLSFQRMHLKGKDKLSIMINEWRHLKDFYDKAEAMGKPLPICVVIGADPVVYVGAGLRYAGDEMEVAGAIRGEAQQVVKSLTSDIRVPATAEFVIEGEILPEVRELEGPLSEFTGHYSTPWMSPVIHVKAITYRDGAIYQTIAGGLFEHVNLGNVLPREPLLKKHATYVSSGVKTVHIPPYGSGFLALVQMKKKNPGEPKNVAMAAMTAYVNIKNVIVVDEDVDIYNPADVLWALSTRVIPEKDIFYVQGAQGHELDPGSDSRGVQTKMGIDATLSFEFADREYERVTYPKVDLNNYLK